MTKKCIISVLLVVAWRSSEFLAEHGAPLCREAGTWLE